MPQLTSMATARAERYDLTMKNWWMSKWALGVWAGVAAITLLLMASDTLSGRWNHPWWVFAGLIASLVVAVVEFVRASKPNA